MYIKGYYNPMFYTPLMKYLSLSSGNNKLSYSLFFQMNQKGLINFRSVEFKQTCVKVNRNYYHGGNLRNIHQLSDLFKLHQVIKEVGILK